MHLSRRRSRSLHLAIPARRSAWPSITRHRHRRWTQALGSPSSRAIPARAADPYWSQPVTRCRRRRGCRLPPLQGPGRRRARPSTLAAIDGRCRRGRPLRQLRADHRRRPVAATRSRVSLDGRGAACRLDGGYLGRDRQHIDNTTDIHHAAPETTSREVYKGVLDEQARGVFQGRIVVQPDAQKTDGHQLNKTILLSDRAEMRYQAGARDLRRRREVQPWRHGRRAGRGRAVLPARPRHRPGRGAAHAGGGLRRRDLSAHVEIAAVRDAFRAACARLAGAPARSDRA